eukprot:TRINITY_DN4764_c0_g1_i1.p1 TRINITY_DN4764_c0_g1~~TRINITY_DN4764_c0_g1_i1.p1  ORF type:complete len:189 (-),score=39.61 TRINITY_DN4764_c0_g1_i1:140-706(-)
MSTMMDIGSKMSSWKEKSKSLLKENLLSDVSGDSEAQKREPTDEEKWESFKHGHKKMSWKQRLIGTGVCWGLGIIFLIFAFVFGVVISTFVIAYSLANVFFIAGSFFLVGPKDQIKSMTHPKRIIATIVYIGALVLTLVFALALDSIGAALIMVIIQILALLWYIASYIPYARTAIKTLLAAWCPCFR